MSGQYAIKGFLYQTMVSLLEALHDLENDWIHITIEPNVGDDKVDILFHYHTHIRAIQVKSSINPITLAKAQKWCEELKQYHEPSKDVLYELQLLGPGHKDLMEFCKKDGVLDEVKVPPPRNADTAGLIEQAAHRLDVFLHNQGTSQLHPKAREFLARALATKLTEFSTDGTKVSRDEFEKLVMQWVVQLVPQTITRVFESQCDVLVGHTLFHGSQLTAGGGLQSHLEFVFPFSFVNGGQRTAIIQQLAVRITDSTGVSKLYQPKGYVDWPSYLNYNKFRSESFMLGSFSQFALMAQSQKECYVLFEQAQNHPDYPNSEWEPGEFAFEVFVKFGDRELPTLVHEFGQSISASTLEGCATNGKYSFHEENISLPPRDTP